MKKFLLMFAFVLCGALAFTSCDREEEITPGGNENNTETPSVEWKAGLDESKAPNQLILRVEVAGGGKVTYVADFKNGLCTKCIATTEYMGYKQDEDLTSVYKDMEYEWVKMAFQAIVDAAQ